MKEKNKRNICIVTPGYISCSPRTVKEADTLYKAGFNVCVIFSQGNLEEPRKFDEILLKTKPWRYRTVGWSPFREEEKVLYRNSKLRYHFFRNLPSLFYSFADFAEQAQGRIYNELARLAAEEKADLYIGHYPDGLAAAAYAASYRKAKLGYDIEDFHTEESIPAKEKNRIRLIENKYLARCVHKSAASELIADEIVKRYNVTRPTVIHNVFSWSERQNLDGLIKDRKGSEVSLYWYSQVVGLDRGIQDAIRAAALLKERVQIHLRGTLTEEVKKKLLGLAKDCRVLDMLYFHPCLPPAELLSRANEHDIGLALDPSVNLNRDLTVANKFFFYFLAGLAIAATDTRGQRNILDTCPEAGFLYPPGDYHCMASQINKLIEDRKKLQDSKEASLKAAFQRWNWEKESQKAYENILNMY